MQSNWTRSRPVSLTLPLSDLPMGALAEIIEVNNQLRGALKDSDLLLEHGAPRLYGDKMSDERQQVTINVVSAEQYSGEWIPEPLTEAIAWLQAKLLSIRVDNGMAYGDAYAEISIEYRRPETDEEMALRKSKRDLVAEEHRRRELATLEALKAKYEAR